MKNWFRKAQQTTNSNLIIVDDEDFWGKCAIKNQLFALLMAVLTLTLECAMLFFYFWLPLKGYPSIPTQYFYIYISAISASIIYIISHHIYKNKNYLMVVQQVYFAFMLFWASAFAVCDVGMDRSPYILIQIMILTATGIRMPSILHCLLNISAFSAYVFMIQAMSLAIEDAFAEILNPVFMVVISCVVVIFSNKNVLRTYKRELLIREQNKQLDYYANYDYLTTIANRKYITEYFEQLLSDENKSVACMLVDIDNFKLYNDTYGHVVGDKCLLRISILLEKIVCEFGAKVGRYGGEEFLVVVHQKLAHEIQELANKLVKSVEAEAIDFSVAQNTNKVVTISVGGYINKKENRVDLESAITFADIALYKVKHSGKNNYYIYDSDIDSL